MLTFIRVHFHSFIGCTWCWVGTHPAVNCRAMIPYTPSEGPWFPLQNKSWHPRREGFIQDPWLSHRPRCSSCVSSTLEGLCSPILALRDTQLPMLGPATTPLSCFPLVFLRCQEELREYSEEAWLPWLAVPGYTAPICPLISPALQHSACCCRHPCWTDDKE